MASPNGTKTAVPSGNTAWAPTVSSKPSNVSSSTLASRSTVPSCASIASRARLEAVSTAARTPLPGFTPYSARIVRIALTSDFTSSNRSSESTSTRSACGTGHAAPANSGSRSPGIQLHNSSVMNGMIGCNSRSVVSKVAMSVARAASPPGALPCNRGFACSTYQSANSSHRKWYTAPAASFNRNASRWSVTSRVACCSRDRIQRSASSSWEVSTSLSDGGVPSRLDRMKRATFQSLFPRFRPAANVASMSSRSMTTSAPAAAPATAV